MSLRGILLVVVVWAAVWALLFWLVGPTEPVPQFKIEPASATEGWWI